MLKRSILVTSYVLAQTSNVWPVIGKGVMDFLASKRCNDDDNDYVPPPSSPVKALTTPRVTRSTVKQTPVAPSDRGSLNESVLQSPMFRTPSSPLSVSSPK